MNPLERFSTILLVAGLAFFGLAVVAEAVLPWQTLRGIPMQPLDEIAGAAPPDFVDLAERYPESFKKYYGQPDTKAFARALRLGRDVYIAEACWHCHSQQVRPVANEAVRFGPVSTAAEQQHELMMPQLMGTRRVGPDLSRESGFRSNDWHAAHFYHPRSVVPTSVMPGYTWFFDGREPNKKGLAMIAYMQWLGSNVERQ